MIDKKIRKVSELTTEELRLLIKMAFDDCLAMLSSNQEMASSDLMKMKEVADYFKVTLVTIHKWRKLRILPPAIKKGGRVFFLRKQIQELIINRQ